MAFLGLGQTHNPEYHVGCAEMVDPAAVVYVGPFPQEPAQALHVPGPSQPASYVQAPVGQRPAHMVVPEGAHSPTRLSPL